VQLYFVLSPNIFILLLAKQSTCTLASSRIKMFDFQIQ
jgi:hypothetical protein